ncbi:DUF4238 domain-containing protein [Dyadobacter crusticola]|uniref:DUF4238 domain-containing protein n=1 Tax=Dyadobacter crusticola TaxID=292407 RepID=UPI0004E1DE6C|nr:DUF4238 domain-containing protein [Dyadobacter crusticola]
MSASEFRKNNHYLSQSYLKHWESSPNKVFVYRRLVSHDQVPVWKEESIEKFAYQEHLYTRRSNGLESDEIERRFANEFESPAESCIQNVVNEDRLTPDDWHKLVRFLALHDLRTPARLLEHIEKKPGIVSKIIEDVLAKIPEQLEQQQQQQNATNTSIDKLKTTFPLKITTEIKDGEEFGILNVETAAGRQSWLSLMEYQLEDTTQILHRHKWTIMHPANGMNWMTSDKPVIRLNYYKPGKYDFKGGLGNKGSEILMPLSPEHMLYTIVGKKPPQRGSRFSNEQTRILRRMIAEHAHRYVFAKYADDEVSLFMPRHIDAQIFKQEKEQWEKWHSEQSESEDFFLT